MKQLFQDYRTGEFRSSEVPAPTRRAGHVIVRTECSAVSVGTERSTMNFAKASLLKKAFARPDLVRTVIAKLRTDGLMATFQASKGRLEVPVPLGYSSAGVIESVGDGVTGLAVGQRVACSGSGTAGHAELASVPAHLVVPVPAGVTSEAASFAAIGAIALHACRAARLSKGDAVVVIGLGLLGQLAVQILVAQGCRVFGVDLDPKRLDQAASFGATVAVSGDAGLADRIRAWAGGSGPRAVIILAATSSNAPLDLAAAACGERGRVVAAGLVGLAIPREMFFKKELDLVVPRAWGYGAIPGQRPTPPEGIDEPTARENLSGFLDLIASGGVRMDRIITHRFDFERAQAAYDLIEKGGEDFLGIVLEYPTTVVRSSRVSLRSANAAASSKVRVGVIGAGLHARTVLLPALAKDPQCTLAALATNHPVESRKLAENFGIGYCTTDAAEVLNDDSIDAVFILTRHDSHAALASAALSKGKAVFLEKPLATTRAGVAEVRRALRSAPKPPTFALGFNRRFAPTTKFVADAFGTRPGPLAVHITVNAGTVDSDSWVVDPQRGGGRLVGEACHFVDLAQCFTSDTIESVYAQSIGGSGEDVLIALRFAGGSSASILYASGGSRAHPRERVEVIGDGMVGAIDNFSRATMARGLRKRQMRHWLSIDRGHDAIVHEFLQCVQQGRPFGLPFENAVDTTLACFAALDSLATGAPVRLRRESDPEIEQREEQLPS